MSAAVNAAADSKANLLRDLALVSDIPVTLTIEVDRTTLSLKELLELRLESLLGSTKPSGSPIQICINGVPVAQGEMVALEPPVPAPSPDTSAGSGPTAAAAGRVPAGVRITQIINLAEETGARL